MLKRDFDAFFNRYFYWNRQFLYMLGLWPFQSRKEQVFRVCIAIFFQIPVPFYQIYWLFTSSFDLDRFYNIVQVVLPALCFMYPYYNVVFNYIKVKLLYSRLKFDIEVASDEREFTILKRYAIQTKWCTVIFMFFVYCYGVILASPSFLNVILYFLGSLDYTQLTLPFPIGCILHPGVVYYSILFYEALAIYIVTTTALAVYTAFISLAQHACSQFTIINMKIHRPFEKNNGNIRYAWYDGAPWDEYNWMVDIIKHYARATEFIKLTNLLTKNISLVEVLLGLFLIMLNFIYLFQFSSLLQNKREALLHGIYFFGTMFTVYINFYVGQRLLDHSSKVFMELCNVSLHKISTKTQKLLLFLMMRGMKPCALSIGGMFTVSHEIYAGLMQKAASYAIACYTMR